MNVIKRLLSELKQYKKSTILASLFSALEVVTDIVVPILMAYIIDKGIVKSDISQVYHYGLMMLIAVIFGLAFGALSGKYAAYSATGLSYNLRESMFNNIQTFSFSNIDKFSNNGLVTRMTTDVNNIQNSYQMIIRVGVRAPMMLITAFVMTMIIEPRMSNIFLGVIAFLGIALGLIVKNALPRFQKVFANYDNLNENVQENVRAIRVVKTFSREEYEKSKFFL